MNSFNEAMQSLHSCEEYKQLLSEIYVPKSGIYSSSDRRRLFRYCFEKGKFEILDKILSLLPSEKEIRKEMLSVDNFGLAVRHGQLETVKWAKNRGGRWAHVTYDIAIDNGKLEILKWFKEIGYAVWGNSASRAVKGGHFETILWMKENGDKSNIAPSAAKYGQIEILKWALANGETFSDYLCSSAAEGGQLEILKWLRENGCPWDKFTCINAAWKGHFETLKWARENGCDWNDETSLGAANLGHSEMLKWIVERGCDWNEQKTFGIASDKGYLPILTWMVDERRFPCDLRLLFRKAVKGQWLDILKWIQNKGLEWKRSDFKLILKKGDIEILIWAVENGCPWTAGQFCFFARKYRWDPEPIQRFANKYSIDYEFFDDSSSSDEED